MKFAHIADTHIRNLKYHFEYREVFKQLYESLKENNVDYIVHCGDIAHTKTQISPEFVEMASEFFENLAEIAPTYVILGNHDGNLRNSSRQDALTPIVNALSHKNLHLLKDSCSVELTSDFSLHVLSVFDEDNWPTIDNSSKESNIALYHGSILSSRTDIGWVMDSTDHDISIFKNYDYAFLGDIHKTQALDPEGRIWYAGSTIQQNFGETMDKGYLLWDIEDKNSFSVEHITFRSPKPFITIPLSKKGNLPRNLNIPTQARLRIVSENNISLDKMRKALDILKYRYDPESVTYLNRAASQQITINSPDGFEKKDLRDIKTQENLMEEYLRDFKVTDDVMKRVFDLNKAYNTQIEESEDILRNVNWSLKSLEWDHLFNYGEGNTIDFAKLEGIVGIFGKNYSGKSSVVDTLLYAMYNSTSKSIRKNLNIINQNHDICEARAQIQIDDNVYEIQRKSEKYTKRLKGQETLEAKTDLEFSRIDLLENVTVLNGTSRQDTDKAIRKHFGSLDDFLMTSMSSQLDSLAFINEGSTKRKEILAKFLDLEIFDKKFKMAKEDSALTKAALRRLEGRDFESLVADIKRQIARSELSIEGTTASCVLIKEEIEKLRKEVTETQAKIDSAPAELVDPILVAKKIENQRSLMEESCSRGADLAFSLKEIQGKYQKVEQFIDSFDIETHKRAKFALDEKDVELKQMLTEMRLESEEKTRNVRKMDLLREVPCGSQFPTCKFIKDAHAAGELVQISSARQSELSASINLLGAEIYSLDRTKTEEYLDKYDLLSVKKNSLATEIANTQLAIERNDSVVFKQRIVLDELLEKEKTYADNKEVIDSLQSLVSDHSELSMILKEKEEELDRCQNKVMMLHKQAGSLEEKLNSTIVAKEEYDTLKTDFAAYDLFMSCCHPNGISYDIIKERLPIINQEIAKILANIVDFEIFIQNDDKKLDIFIKHPRHDPRPLEMGSGAEKTIASMAIRLAFLTVSSLPKSDLFILDEPGTALDEENMEGFTRLLDMIKGYFKTVILISHLDGLKDCVDMQINIERRGDYAYINI